MIEIRIITTTILLAWFIVNFPVFKWIINTFKDYGIYKYVNQVFSCIKCASLYVGIIVTLYYDESLLLALAASFLADLYDKHLNVIKF